MLSEQIVSLDMNYTNFLCSYFRQHPQMHPRDLIHNAIRTWKNFTSDERNAFGITNPAYHMLIESVPSNLSCGGSSTWEPVTDAPLRRAVKRRKNLKGKARRTAKRTSKQAKSKRTRRSAQKNYSTQAFLNFLRKYREACASSDRESMAKAAKAWCNLSDQERKRFAKMPRLSDPGISRS